MLMLVVSGARGDTDILIAESFPHWYGSGAQEQSIIGMHHHAVRDQRPCRAHPLDISTCSWNLLVLRIALSPMGLVGLSAPARLPLDWPKLHGTVAALAAQASGHARHSF